jgi:23S rRNA G2069 N7-methylase RlmK/C1962 C5-methylase RlmI
MNITLLINEEERIFNTVFIKGRSLRKVLLFREEMNFENLKVKDLDELVGLIVDTFNNQFTIDEFYDGIPSESLMKSITETFNEIVNPNQTKDVESTNTTEGK